MGGLSGMKQITRFCNRSEATILAWIRERDFPACKITGSWESDTELIDQWRKKQIDDKLGSQIKPRRSKNRTRSSPKNNKTR